MTHIYPEALQQLKEVAARRGRKMYLVIGDIIDLEFSNKNDCKRDKKSAENVFISNVRINYCYTGR